MLTRAISKAVLTVAIAASAAAATAQTSPAPESEQERLARRLNQKMDESEHQAAKDNRRLKSENDGLGGLSDRTIRDYRQRMFPPDKQAIDKSRNARRTTGPETRDLDSPTTRR